MIPQPTPAAVPGGLAIANDGSLYVTNNSIRAGAGQLLHIIP
jgi:hypothetical protein